LNAERSRRVFALMLAALFAMATALMVLLAYLVAELYLANKGWLIALPDGRELAHVRIRNLLLIFGLPAMALLGFAVGWFSHASTQPAPRPPESRSGPDDRTS